MSVASFAVVPLLVKISFTGFTPFEWSRSERCEVFENQVVVTKTYSSTTVEYKFPLVTEELPALIEKAVGEELSEEGNRPCDGPSTIVMAMHQGHEVPLYSTGGCGVKKHTRQGPHSAALLDIANTFCSTTYE